MRIEVYALKDVEGQEEPQKELQVTYTLPNLDEIGKNEVALKEGSTKPKVTLNFELNRSHLFKLKSASAAIDEKVIEEVVVDYGVLILQFVTSLENYRFPTSLTRWNRGL